MKTRGRATAPLPQGWNSHPSEDAGGCKCLGVQRQTRKWRKGKTKPIPNLLSTLARYVYEDLDPHSGAGVGETPQEREVMALLQPCTHSPRRAFATAGELQGCFQHGKTRENRGGGKLEHSLHPGVCVLHRAPRSGRH